MSDNVQMSFWIPPELKKKFKIQMAKNGDDNQSEVIRKLIKEYYLEEK